MSAYTLNVSDPADDFDDDSPACLVPPGDRWCSLWGPRGPCHPSIEGTADEWMLIAGAIEAGAPRAFKRVAFGTTADGGHLWSPRNTTGLADHVILAAAELLDLVRSIRDQLAPTAPPAAPALCPADDQLRAQVANLTRQHCAALVETDNWRRDAKGIRATAAALAARWRQGSADGDDRTAADCADELDALLAGRP